ncbi:ATP-binding cassette domain-containing protein, partial [Treponema sp. R6D11]
ISNVIKKSSGSVIYDGVEISSVPPDRIVAQGLVQVPEGRRIFANLSVRDNLEMGAYSRRAVTLSEKHAIRKDMDKVFDIFPRLKERIRQVAGTLSGGEQQMLA